MLMIPLLSACGGIAGFDGGSWSLVSIAGQPLVEGTSATLIFDGKQAGGNASCNSWGGTVKISGSTMVFSDLFMTEMYCTEPAGVMEQESAYLSMLGEVYEFTMNDENSLTLRMPSGEELLFTRLVND
jgi:heat shock protein HslJ